MQESTPAPKVMTPLYTKEKQMLEGLEDKELEWYLDENPRIVPLFKIDVGGTTETYAAPAATTARDGEPSEEAIVELRHAQDAFDRKIEISRRVTVAALEEINFGTSEGHGPTRYD